MQVERSGALWTPKRRPVECIGGTAGGAFAARALVSSKGDPRTWPGNAGLEAWYRWNLGQVSDTTLNCSNVTAPVVTFTGTPPVACGLKLTVTTTGTRATFVAHYSYRNGDGTDWITIGPGLGSTVTLTNGMVLALPAGTYTSGDVYIQTRSQWRDQKNSHHYSSIDGVAGSPKNPFPKVTAYGTFVSFDGISHVLSNQTTLAQNVVGGTAKAFYICGVFLIDSTSPSSGSGNIVFFGDPTGNHAYIWYFSSTPNHKALKTDNTNTDALVTGGTPNTSIHVYEIYQTGTTVTVRVDGAAAIATTAQAPGGNVLTVTTSTIGKTFLSGAEGNPAAITWGELAIYSTPPSTTDQTDNAARMRASHSF